jgi:hypothetical protein
VYAHELLSPAHRGLRCRREAEIQRQRICTPGPLANSCDAAAGTWLPAIGYVRGTAQVESSLDALVTSDYAGVYSYRFNTFAIN